jgi:TM2 domain-containing membrane protein YozV
VERRGQSRHPFGFAQDRRRIGEAAVTDQPTRSDIALKVRQLLGQATLLRTRGQRMQAFQLTQEAIRLAEQSWEAHELQGDVLMDMGRATEAMTSYRRARELRPDRIALEDKIARGALRAAARNQMLAQADLVLGDRGRGGDAKRKSGYAALFSLMPGLGQIYNGQVLKGIVVGIVMVIFIAVASQQLDVSLFRTSLLGGVSPVWAALIALLWLYSVIDAIIYASKNQEAGPPGSV